MLEVGCVCMKKIITISLYLLASILLIMCFFGFYPRFLEAIKGSCCSFSTVAEFVVCLSGAKVMFAYITSFLLTIYGIVWLLIKKMHKINIFNSIMVCSLLYILFFMLSPLNIPMVVISSLTLVILCLYINIQTPYITQYKNDGLDYITLFFLLLLFILQIYFFINDKTSSLVFIISAIYLVLVAILYISKKRAYFYLEFIFSFVSILTMLPYGIQNYVVNSNTGEIYINIVERQQIIDLLHNNFDSYKDVLVVKTMFNIQFYLYLFLMIILLVLVFFKCRSESKRGLS